MSNTRAGVRAARALLSLIEDNSIEEFEAAERILGGQEELATILLLIRQFKEHKGQKDKPDPISVDRLREIAFKEILGLTLKVSMIREAVREVFPQIDALRVPPNITAESFLRQAFEKIEGAEPSPRHRAKAYISLLLDCSVRAGNDHVVRIVNLMRDLAIQGLTENIIVFPALHSIAQLRTRWSKTPLPYRNHETRRDLATRLLADAAECYDPVEFPNIVAELLRESLRAPTDLAMTMLREMKTKKAHAE